MRLPLIVIGLTLTACKGTLPPYVAPQDVDTEAAQDVDTDTDAVQHDARFVGLWAVEQPFHAAFEVTYYDFQADGTLVTEGSLPENCAGHLRVHCVTGTVSDCVVDPTMTWCEPETTCIFGERWHTNDDQTLVIEGECTDDVTRNIVLQFNGDSSQNSQFGITPNLLTVGAQTGWAHNGWEWAFRKCPEDGTDCALF